MIGRAMQPALSRPSVLFAVLVVSSMAIAACSTAIPPGSTPTAAASAGATQVSATPTAAATASTPQGTASAPTETAVVVTPSPTFAGQVDLEALIPDEISGVTLNKRSMTGTAIFPPGQSLDRFLALLTVLGMTADDASAAQGQGISDQGELVIIEAYRVAGADSAALLNGLVEIFGQAEIDATWATPATVAGKQVIIVGEATTELQYKAHFYGYGDVVFQVVYNGPNAEEWFEEIFSNLP